MDQIRPISSFKTRHSQLDVHLRDTFNNKCMREKLSWEMGLHGLLGGEATYDVRSNLAAGDGVHSNHDCGI